MLRKVFQAGGCSRRGTVVVAPVFEVRILLFLIWNTFVEIVCLGFNTDDDVCDISPYGIDIHRDAAGDGGVPVGDVAGDG